MSYTSLAQSAADWARVVYGMGTPVLLFYQRCDNFEAVILLSPKGDGAMICVIHKTEKKICQRYS